ncbi:MAG: hypothetical protein JWR55_486 [Aeromicrobium sp.]|jgi:hypothetical protein|nr:hypothetical protein [Aeromicrobium sp.]
MADSCTCSCASTRRRRRPTATFVIATLALFMSLGGTSYAAVKAKSIGTKQLKDSSVTSAKIARAGVTASDIRANVIDGTKIRAGSIGSQHILDGSIGAQDIQPGSIGAREIAANSINSQQIADQSLGLGELNQAAVDLFRDVPTTLVLEGGNQATQGMPNTSLDGTASNAFTMVRSTSIPAATTGTTLIQSLTSVESTGDTVVTCWIARGDDVLATSSTTPRGRAVLAVTAMTSLAETDAVETRCQADGTATADTRTSTGATSMTLMRVDD